MITREENIKIFKKIEEKKQKALEDARERYRHDPDNFKLAENFINETSEHSKNLHLLVEGEPDIFLSDFHNEYPHDLQGQGNKFNLDILSVMMLPKTPIDFTKKEKETIAEHSRLQHHHQVSNIASATSGEQKIWAADIILAWREKRVYKSVITWDEIFEKLIQMSCEITADLLFSLKWAAKKLYNSNREKNSTGGSNYEIGRF